MNISYESDELIEELKQDIKEFGENHECFAFVKQIGDTIIYTNYDFDAEENPIANNELEEDEYLLKTTLGEALKQFEKQNKII